MAGIIVNRGLQVAGDRVAGIGGPPAAYKAIAWDDAAGAANSFLAAHTKLNDRAGATQLFAADPDATFPSRNAQTVSYRSTIPAASFNGVTIGRVSLHNADAVAVTLASATLVAGVDQQSILKNADFALSTQIDVLYTSV